MVKTNPYDMRVALADARYAQISLTKEFQQLELLRVADRKSVV